jgi:two-component system, OmpR family, sensor kinase
MRALHLRLTAAIAALIAVVAVALLAVVGRTSARYADEVQQRLNADVARYVVEELPLFEGAAVNEAALAELARRVMTVNPSAEVYLLDPAGRISATLVPRERIVADVVDIRPLEAFLGGERNRPIYGSDPTNRDARRVFSAARLPASEARAGYLYVVLGGEPAQSVAAGVRRSYVLRAAVLAVLIPLGAVLLLAAGLFWVLTRRLRALDARMQQWMTRLPIAVRDDAQGLTHSDEIDALHTSFERMARTIERQLEELRTSDALRRELVAHVSHDLRTPLAALRGYLETVRMKGDSLPVTSQKEYLDVAVRHAEQLGHLIEALFELAKLESGGASLAREPFALAELLHDIAARYRLQAQKGGVTLRALTSPNAALAIGDIALVERAIANLLDNALRHTPQGGFIRMEMWSEPRQMRVRISDTGSGMASAEEDPPARGGGLGLTIVKRIFELHGQSFRILSGPGAGTSVEFTLEAAAPAAIEPVEVSARAASIAGADDSRR